MDDILNNFRANTASNDYIRIFINHSNMSYPISLPYVKVRDLTTEMLLTHIAKVLQSNKLVNFHETMRFEISIVRIENRTGQGKRITDFIVAKKSIVAANTLKTHCAV